MDGYVGFIWNVAEIAGASAILFGIALRYRAVMIALFTMLVTFLAVFAYLCWFGGAGVSEWAELAALTTFCVSPVIVVGALLGKGAITLIRRKV